MASNTVSGNVALSSRHDGCSCVPLLAFVDVLHKMGMRARAAMSSAIRACAALWLSASKEEEKRHEKIRVARAKMKFVPSHQRAKACTALVGIADGRLVAALGGEMQQQAHIRNLAKSDDLVRLLCDSAVTVGEKKQSRLLPVPCSR